MTLALIPLCHGKRLLSSSRVETLTPTTIKNDDDEKNLPPTASRPPPFVSLSSSSSSSSTAPLNHHHHHHHRNSSNIKVLGRSELLRCYWRACGCHHDASTSRHKCSSCQQVNLWALPALSRHMLQFHVMPDNDDEDDSDVANTASTTKSPTFSSTSSGAASSSSSSQQQQQQQKVHLWIRGRHVNTLLQIQPQPVLAAAAGGGDGIAVVPFEKAVHRHQYDDWQGPYLLSVPTILTFQPPIMTTMSTTTPNNENNPNNNAAATTTSKDVVPLPLSFALVQVNPLTGIITLLKEEMELLSSPTRELLYHQPILPSLSSHHQQQQQQQQQNPSSDSRNHTHAEPNQKRMMMTTTTTTITKEERNKDESMPPPPPLVPSSFHIPSQPSSHPNPPCHLKQSNSTQASVEEKSLAASALRSNHRQRYVPTVMHNDHTTKCSSSNDQHTNRQGSDHCHQSSNDQSHPRDDDDDDESLNLWETQALLLPTTATTISSPVSSADACSDQNENDAPRHSEPLPPTSTSHASKTTSTMLSSSLRSPQSQRQQNDPGHGYKMTNATTMKDTAKIIVDQQSLATFQLNQVQTVDQFALVSQKPQQQRIGSTVSKALPFPIKVTLPSSSPSLNNSNNKFCTTDYHLASDELVHPPAEMPIYSTLPLHLPTNSLCIHQQEHSLANQEPHVTSSLSPKPSIAMHASSYDDDNDNNMATGTNTPQHDMVPSQRSTSFLKLQGLKQQEQKGSFATDVSPLSPSPNNQTSCPTTNPLLVCHLDNHDAPKPIPHDDTFPVHPPTQQELLQVGTSEVQEEPSEIPSLSLSAHKSKELVTTAYAPSTNPDHDNDNTCDNDHVAPITTPLHLSTFSTAPSPPFQEPQPQQQQPQPVLYFVRRGGLSQKRIQCLANNAKSRGATVIDQLDSSFLCHNRGSSSNRAITLTHLVMEPTTSVKALLAELQFPGEDSLRKWLDENGVECVTTAWITKGESLQKPPLAKRRWYGLPIVRKRRVTSSSKQSEQEQSNDSFKRQRLGPRSLTPSLVDDDGSRQHDSDKRAVSSSFKAKNVEISELFLKLSKLHQSCPLLPEDAWKAYSFHVTAGRLRHLSFEIQDDDPYILAKIRQVRGFGDSALRMIQEYITTGSFQRIQAFETDPERVAMKKMMAIWGVGRVKASELVKMGYKDISQVRKGLESGKLDLDRNQRIGVECYEDILEEMDRNEVEKIGSVVAEVAKELVPGVDVIIMGSYRRGKPACGDVDVFLTHKDYADRVPPTALGSIVDTLRASGHIAYHLTHLVGMKSLDDMGQRNWSSKPPNKEITTYFGVFRSPVVSGKRRRVDIKFFPYRERVFATLYFTGNGFFNRSMRLWASRKFQWLLNEKGLFTRDMRTRVMEADTERQVFERLQLEYKEPHERDCFDAVQAIDRSEVTSHDDDEEIIMTRAEINRDENEHCWIE